MFVRKFTEYVHVHEFSSLSDFAYYIENTSQSPRWKRTESHDKSRYNTNWSGTRSYDEALDLLLNGWSPAAEKIAIALETPSLSTTTKTKPTFSPVGYAPSVPRYLNNMPDAMVSSRRVHTKIPVITMTVNIGWQAHWSNEEIMQEGIKILQKIKSIEDSGTRVRLNVAAGAKDIREEKVHAALKITIKEPGERLNISKMAFALAHTSMYRRLVFAWLERNHDMPFELAGYGMPGPLKEIWDRYYPDEQFINNKNL